MIINEEIFDRFSCNDWIVISLTQFEYLKKELHLAEKVLDENVKWRECYFDFDSKENLLIVSPAINDWILIEANKVDKLISLICKLDSKLYDFFYFHIDLWIPTMTFKYYEKGELKRYYNYFLEEGEITIEEYGEKLDFENENLETVSSSFGYDYFFYPLAILFYLGISYEQLLLALDKEKKIYSF